MQDSHKIARAVLRAARVKPAAFLVGEAADVIAAALEEARREERERCARIVQDVFHVSSFLVALALLEQTLPLPPKKERAAILDKRNKAKQR